MNQRKKVLLRLAIAPAKNYEFPIKHKVLNYTARLEELRNKCGFDISTERIANGVYEYTLNTPIDKIDFDKCRVVG